MSKVNKKQIPPTDAIVEQTFTQMKRRILSALGSNPNSSSNDQISNNNTTTNNNDKQQTCDLSPKGSVDVKCLPVIDLLNKCDEYVTTSSCSGRIALFHSLTNESAKATTASENGDEKVNDQADKTNYKRGSEAALGWLFVKHGMLTYDEQQMLVNYLCGTASTPHEIDVDVKYKECMETEMQQISKIANRAYYGGEVGGTLQQDNHVNNMLCKSNALPSLGTISLKMEPFVMHVACRSMPAAKQLLTCALTECGFRNSGVVPPGNKIMCAIRTTNGLGMEVPIMLHGHNFARSCDRQYLWELLWEANRKMYQNELKINLLEEKLAQCVKV